MRLTDLEPRFCKVVDEKSWNEDDSFTVDEADGIRFLCPRCWETNGGSVGTHSVICWRPRVGPDRSPKPGRWDMVGTSYADLSLVAGSSSVHLTGPGCGAHFHVTAGDITWC